MTGPDGVLYTGTLNSSRVWRRLARKHGVFLALAGSISHPSDVAAAEEDGEMYARLCPGHPGCGGGRRLTSTTETGAGSPCRAGLASARSENGPMDLAYTTHLGPPSPSFQIVGRPCDLWPRETELVDWLLAHLDQLGECPGMKRLEFVGREVRVGEQWQDIDVTGQEIWVGGLRMDIVARDEHARTVVIEAQLGSSDHRHLGQLLTYAHAAQAAVVVWVAAGRDFDPPFRHGHLAALAELNDCYTGRRVFHAVALSVESEHRPQFVVEDSLRPQLNLVDLAPAEGGFRYATAAQRAHGA